jgi:hypothetical protein
VIGLLFFVTWQSPMSLAGALGGLCVSLAIFCPDPIPPVQKIASFWQAKKSQGAVPRSSL